MKKHITKVLAIGALFFISASCSDDAEPTTLEKVNFKSGIEVSNTTIVLSPENKYKTVTNISWPAVDYPVDAPVSYALQIDVPADTLGTTAWQNAIRIDAGQDVLSKSFLGNELNKIAKELGLPIDIPGEIVVRVESNLDRTAYSKAIVLTVTPFVQVITQTEIYMPGDYQGWDPATAAKLYAIEGGVFQGYLTFPPDKTREFKITTDPDGDIFYGWDADGNFVENGFMNIAVPTYGSYRITVDLNAVIYTAEPYSFGIVGTATTGGWFVDTDMTYDYVNKVWKFVGPLVPGALKFRLNDSWAVNYGTSANGTVMQFDNGGAHTIGEAGIYEVTFAVNTNPATANYSVIKLD